MNIKPFLIFYSIIITLLFAWSSFSHLKDLNDLKDFAKANGDSYTAWAFGKDWTQEKVSDAVSDWNKKHKDCNFRDDSDLRDAVKQIAVCFERQYLGVRQ